MSRFKNIIHTTQNHQGFRRYFANTTWMFGEQTLRMLAGILVGVWVARFLGPEQFGLFSYAIAFASLFGSIAKLGLDSIVVRDLVIEPTLCNTYMGTAFWLKLVGAFLMIVTVAFATLLTSNDSTTNLYVFIIASGIIFQSFEVVDFYFQSQVLSKFVSICKIIQLLISSLIKIYLVLIGSDIFWFVIVSLVDQITLAISLYIAYRCQKIGGFFRNFEFSLAKKMLKNSWPLIFSGLAVTLYMRIDQVMIKEMLGDKEVGLFSAAVRLSEVWYFVPVIIMNSIFPSIVSANKVSKSFYMNRLLRIFTLMTWLAVFIALPMSFFSSSIINLIYGYSYQDAGLVLAIHIWSAVFVFLGVASGVFFTIENYTMKTLYRTLLGAFTNLLFNMLLIPYYGIVGAALATLIAQFTSNLLYDFFDPSLKPLLIIKLKALFPIYYFRFLKE